MGFWSSIKKAVKKVWRVVKAVVRIVVRAVLTVVAAVVNLFDLLLGFLNWPPKKLRLHVFILRDEAGVEVLGAADLGQLTAALDSAKHIFKDRFNVSLVPYSKGFVETLPDPAPTAALEPKCDAGAWADEFREAGEYYAGHLAGWVSGIPISASFPITAFIVRDVDGKRAAPSARSRTTWSSTRPGSSRTRRRSRTRSGTRATSGTPSRAAT